MGLGKPKVCLSTTPQNKPDNKTQKTMAGLQNYKTKIGVKFVTALQDYKLKRRGAFFICNPGWSNGSAPVLCTTARLSLRYLHLSRILRKMGFGCLNVKTLGAIPLPQHMNLRLDAPCARGVSQWETMPHESKENWVRYPLCESISKSYCAIWGVISNWAAEGLHLTF